MSKIRSILNIVGVMMFIFVVTSLAQAQATRTWVSGVGDDANPCSRTAPCKTFAGAISKTAAAGEISVLDPAGFGAINITKSITINGEGTLGGILASLVNGVIVNANASTDVVYLKNLSINGAGNGLNGIRYLSAKALHVVDCQIYGFNSANAGAGHGIDMSLTTTGRLFVSNTGIRNCLVAGIRATTTSGFAIVSIDNVQANGLATGVIVGDRAFVNIRNSSISQGTTGVSIGSVGGSSATIANSILSNNSTAISCSGTLQISGSVVANNTTGVATSGSPTLRSGGDNRFLGNGSDGTALTVILPK